MIHFYFQLPNVADWFGLALTVIGLAIAWYAFKRWKKEKEWDILIESISFAPIALEYVEFVYNIQSDETVFNEKTIENAEDIGTKKLISLAVRKQKRLNKAEEHIRLLSYKLDFVFKNKQNEVQLFYAEIKGKLDEFVKTERNLIMYYVGVKAHERNPDKKSKEIIKSLNKKISESYQKKIEIPEDELMKLKKKLDKVKCYEIK